MKKLIEEYGESILYIVYGSLAAGLFAGALYALSF